MSCVPWSLLFGLCDHGATTCTRLLELVKHPEDRKARSACGGKGGDNTSMVYGDAHRQKAVLTDGCEASAIRLGFRKHSTAQPSPIMTCPPFFDHSQVHLQILYRPCIDHCDTPTMSTITWRTTSIHTGNVDLGNSLSRYHFLLLGRSSLVIVPWQTASQDVGPCAIFLRQESRASGAHRQDYP